MNLFPSPFCYWLVELPPICKWLFLFPPRVTSGWQKYLPLYVIGCIVYSPCQLEDVLFTSPVCKWLFRLPPPICYRLFHLLPSVSQSLQCQPQHRHAVVHVWPRQTHRRLDTQSLRTHNTREIRVRTKLGQIVQIVINRCTKSSAVL